MTPGPWHLGDADWRVVIGSETRYRIAKGVTRLSQVAYVGESANEAEDMANAVAIRLLPDLIKNARAVLTLLKPLMKHAHVLEYPEAATLLTSVELGELARILETVKM